MLLRYLGHASFEIHTSSKRILIDPFLRENPAAARPNEKADIVFITHEHFDHCVPDDIRKNISSGAIVVPLVTSAGCIGVMAAEVQNGAEAEPGEHALATILAAQLSTLITPAPTENAVQAQG